MIGIMKIFAILKLVQFNFFCYFEQNFIKICKLVLEKIYNISGFSTDFSGFWKVMCTRK